MGERAAYSEFGLQLVLRDGPAAVDVHRHEDLLQVGLELRVGRGRHLIEIIEIILVVDPLRVVSLGGVGGIGGLLDHRRRPLEVRAREFKHVCRLLRQSGRDEVG